MLSLTQRATLASYIAHNAINATAGAQLGVQQKGLTSIFDYCPKPVMKFHGPLIGLTAGLPFVGNEVGENNLLLVSALPLLTRHDPHIDLQFAKQASSGRKGCLSSIKDILSDRGEMFTTKGQTVIASVLAKID